MTHHDFDYYDENTLLYRAKWGKLTEEELKAVRQTLLDPDSDEERYLSLYILGRAGDPRFVPVVEPFLDSPEDPTLGALALTILCDYWELADRYRGVMMEYILGTPWDDERDAKLSALSEAGKWLRHQPDAELLALLLKTALEDDETEDEFLVRDAAMYALGRAVGLPWSQLPRVSKGLKPDSELGREILEKARARLAQGG